MNNNERKLTHVDEILKLLAWACGDDRFITVLNSITEEERTRGITMSYVMDKLNKLPDTSE